MDKYSSTKKVLIIDNSPGTTGAFSSIYSAVRVLSRQCDFVFLIDKKSTNAAIIGANHIPVIKYHLLEISKRISVLFYLPVLINNAIKLNKYIKVNEINILHINDLYNMLGVIVKIFNPGVKLVYHVRLLPTSYAGKLYKIWSRLIEKYADKIICVSEAVASNFSSKTEVIYDAIELIEIHPLKKKQPEIEFIYLANYTRGKGHEHALKAFAKARPLINNARLALYGSTFDLKKNQSFKVELSNLAIELGIEFQVTINEFSEDPEKIIRSADIMLNFSESESFSMTTLEAIAYGTPVIVTDCGGPSEIIEDGISGILVPVNDIDAMTAAIVELAASPELRESLAKNGYERARQKFNLKKQAEKLAALYTSLLPTSTSPQ